MKLLLCIDDDPIRYRKVAKLLKGSDISIAVSCNLEEVRFYLDTHEIMGVCLDHDMRAIDGQYFARHVLAEKNHRVAIVSNNYDGAKKIAAVFEEYEVPYCVLPASASDEWASAIVDVFGLLPR